MSAVSIQPQSDALSTELSPPFMSVHEKHGRWDWLCCDQLWQSGLRLDYDYRVHLAFFFHKKKSNKTMGTGPHWPRATSGLHKELMGCWHLKELCQVIGFWHLKELCWPVLLETSTVSVPKANLVACFRVVASLQRRVTESDKYAAAAGFNLTEPTMPGMLVRCHTLRHVRDGDEKGG